MNSKNEMRFQDEGVVGVHFNKFFFSLTSSIKSQKARYRSNGLFSLARQEGLEPPTFWFVAKHSIQLSYWRICGSFQTAHL